MLNKKPWLTLLALAFMLHGIYYFFFPDQVHDDTASIKYLKYVLILFFVLLSIGENITAKLIYFALWIPLLLYYYLINADPTIANFIGYILPVYFLMSRQNLVLINWRSCCLVTLIVASALGYYEVFVLENHFYMYNSTKADYRMVSIFVNPNNLGITVAILTFVFIHYFSTKPVLSFLAFCNGLLIVLFSGSKTALGIFMLFSLYFVYLSLVRKAKDYRLSANRMKVITSLIPFAFVGGFFFLSKINFSKIRDLNFESLVVRLTDYSEFLQLVYQNPFFPWLEKTKNVDNVFLHLWGSFGLPGLLMFILFNWFILMHIRKESLVIFLLTFLIIGFSTNFLYLWPLGYFYWATVSFAINSFFQKGIGSKNINHVSYPEN